MDSSIFLLPNGLRVLSINVPHTASTKVCLYANVGSRYEEPEVQGVSHFLEHMIFKGTKTRTGDDLNKEVDYWGSDINAFTSKDTTGYWIRGLTERTESFFEILSDILTNSTFPEDEMEKERLVIQQERIMGLDDIYDVQFECVNETMFPDQPVGRPIIGTEESINRITRQDLLNHLHKFYTGSNMVLGVVGKVDHEQIHEWASQYFGHIEHGTRNHYEPSVLHTDFGSCRPEFEQSLLFISWPSVGPRAPKQERNANNLLTTVISDGMSSPLVTEIRERRGLAYSVSMYYVTNDDLGFTCITSSTTEDKLDTLISAAVEVLQGILLLPQQEFSLLLERAKNQKKVEAISLFERPTSLLDFQRESLHYDGFLTPLADELAGIEAVAVDQVRSCLSAILAKTPSTVITGPGGDSKHYEHLLQELKTLNV